MKKIRNIIRIIQEKKTKICDNLCEIDYRLSTFAKKKYNYYLRKKTQKKNEVV